MSHRHKAWAAHCALPGQTPCAFHGMKSVLGEFCPASLVSRVNRFYHLPTCHGKKQNIFFFLTPGSRFPIDHLKFGLVTYYLNIWHSEKKKKSLTRIQNFSFILALMLVKNLLFLHNSVPGEPSGSQKFIWKCWKVRIWAYLLTDVTSCEAAWTSVTRYFLLQFDLVKMCLKFTLLLTRITTSWNWRAPETRLQVQSNLPAANGAFPGNKYYYFDNYRNRSKCLFNSC